MTGCKFLIGSLVIGPSIRESSCLCDDIAAQVVLFNLDEGLNRREYSLTKALSFSESIPVLQADLGTAAPI